MHDPYTPAQGLKSIFQIPGFLETYLNAFFAFFVGNAGFVVLLGILQFIYHAEDEEARKTGRKMIIWGIIGIFIMLSIWGLVRVLTNTTNLNNTAPPVPQVQI